VTLFGLTEVQFGTSGQLVGKLMRIWGGYDLFEMDPTNGRVAFVVSSDYSEHFPLRSALIMEQPMCRRMCCHAKLFFTGIAGAAAESESRKNWDSLD
jgi:hypothetical protein